MEWHQIKESFKVNQIVTGKVVQHSAFGYFIDLGLPYLGLVQITDIRDTSDSIKVDEYPKIGETVKGVILGFKENNQQIWVGTKKSQLAQGVE